MFDYDEDHWLPKLKDDLLSYHRTAAIMERALSADIDLTIRESLQAAHPAVLERSSQGIPIFFLWNAVHNNLYFENVRTKDDKE